MEGKHDNPMGTYQLTLSLSGRSGRRIQTVAASVPASINSWRTGCFVTAPNGAASALQSELGWR